LYEKSKKLEKKEHDMDTACCTDLSCSVNNILQRITPITYQDNMLVIDSPLSVGTALTLQDTTLQGSGGVLGLPEGTTVGGTPLLSPHTVDGMYQLPDKTILDQFPVLNTNYFYYYTTNLPSVNFQSGYFINNRFSGSSSTTEAANYPFFAPRDCVLTSLLFSLVVGPIGSSITNATATLYTVSLTGVVANTGVSVVIPACPVNTRNYADTTFQYPIHQGCSVGVKVAYAGSAYHVDAFATLGYSFL
jgi:hypothetical protein